MPKPSADAGSAAAWMVRLRAATGPTLWRAMEEASAWLETQPGATADEGWRGLRDQIASVRYGGSVVNPEVQGEFLRRPGRRQPHRAPSTSDAGLRVDRRRDGEKQCADQAELPHGILPLCIATYVFDAQSLVQLGG